MVLKMRPLGGSLGLDDVTRGGPCDGIRGFEEENKSSLSTLWTRASQEVSITKSRVCWLLDLGCPASRTVRSKYLLYKHHHHPPPPPLPPSGVIVTAAGADYFHCLLRFLYEANSELDHM